MDFYVMARTYNIYGGHSTLSLIPDFLLRDAEEFGPALTELTVTFHFPYTGQARRTLEEAFENFHANRQSLPKVVFRRKRGKAAIDIASELLDGKDWKQKRDLSLSLFNGAVVETVAALELLKKRFTGQEDFKLEAFLGHCQKALKRLPSNLEELITFAEGTKKRQAAHYAAMSPWDRLGIDWRDFHPDARKVLDNPFLWESSNDFAPNGNDTGADVLANYRKWLRRNPTEDPITFYHEQICRWGYPPEPIGDLDRTVRDEAAVALAFAELKLRADCRPSVVVLARAAIERQRQKAIEAVNWTHRGERLNALEVLEAKLQICSQIDRCT